MHWYLSFNILGYQAFVCSISQDNGSYCVKCSETTPYMHLDKACYAKCPTGYFGDDYDKQCKPCHSSCLTCNGLTSTSCTSCGGSNYLVPDKKLCDFSCEKYGLTKSNSVSNLCTLCKHIIIYK